MIILNNRKKQLFSYSSLHLLINICTFERDKNNRYKINMIDSTKKSPKVITMIKEGGLYKPLYINVGGEKQAMFKHNDKIIEQLLNE